MHLIESLSTVRKTSRENWKRTWKRAAPLSPAEQHEKATEELIRESSIRPENHLAASNMESGLDESWRVRFDGSNLCLDSRDEPFPRMCRLSLAILSQIKLKLS
jgi:hypothetical protein